MQGVERCGSCGALKPLIEFCRDKSTITGHSSMCKKCHNSICAAYKKRHPEKVKLSAERYRKSKKGELSKRRYYRSKARRVAKKRYYQLPIGKAAAIRHLKNRNVRITNVSNDLTAQEWKDILTKQNYRCNACHGLFNESVLSETATRDHVIPVLEGGCLTKENIHALCKSCNSKKGTKEWFFYINAA